MSAANFIVAQEFDVNAASYGQGVAKEGDKNFDLLYQNDNVDLNGGLLSHIIFEFAADDGHSTQPKSGVTTSTDDFDADFKALFGTGMNLVRMNGQTNDETNATAAPTVGTDILTGSRWNAGIVAETYSNDGKTEEKICRDATAVANFGNPILQQFTGITAVQTDTLLADAVKATVDLANDDETAPQWVTKLALEAFSSANYDTSDDLTTHGRMKACNPDGSPRTVTDGTAADGPGLYKFNLKAGDAVYFKFKITCTALQAPDGSTPASALFTGADGTSGEIAAVVKLVQS